MVLIERYCPGCGAASLSIATVCQACGGSLKATVPLSDTGNFAFYLTHHLQEGQLFKERYRIIRQVGIGGFGAVYQAEDTWGQRQVAIKEIGLTGLTPQQVIDVTGSFNREYQMLSSLQHQSIPRLYEQLTDAEHWYLVMEFIAGETLEDLLAQAPGGCLSVEQALKISLQLCHVLHYLHNFQPVVIFRDIKPANIMITPDYKLYLLDFGVARQYKPGKLKDTIAFGSPGYAAPEQYGRAQTTPLADIYSLGVLLHQMLSGQDPSLNPLHFFPLHAYNQGLPAELEHLVAQMVESEIERRPQNVDEVRRKLQALAASPAVTRLKKKQARSVPHSQASQVNSFSTRGVTVAIYRGHSTGVNVLRWSPDGHLIASCDNQLHIHTWDAFQSRSIHAWSLPRQNRNDGKPVDDIAWFLDGEVRATACKGVEVHFWDLGKRPGWWQNLIFSLDWSSNTYCGHSAAVSALSLAPDGLMAASGDSVGQVHIWDALSEQEVGVYHHTDAVQALAWSPDGAKVASSSSDHSVCVWDVDRHKVLWREQMSKHLTTHSLAWSPHGDYLACGTRDGLIQVWQSVPQRRVYVYHHHKATVNAVAWSPDGLRIASASSDGSVRVWDAQDGKNTFTYRGHEDEVFAVSWSPDGQHIASAGKDATVQIWKTS